MHRYFLLLGGLICAGGPVLFASGIDATATYTDSWFRQAFSNTI